MDEFTHSGSCRPGQVSISVSPPDISVYMDPSQLHQVVWNLCQNAVRSTKEDARAVTIRLVGARTDASRGPHLDIIDNGPGIEPAMTDKIFEPFFTTRNTGTGLGLYIAREICESNQARLVYRPDSAGGSCFRITFPETGGLATPVYA